MARSGRNKSRTRTRSAEELARIKEETKKTLTGAAGIALFAIPGGGFIRAGMTAGKIAPRVLAKIKQLGGKRVAKPTAAQVDKAVPVSKAGEKLAKASKLGRELKARGPATRGGRRGRKDLKPERKVDPGASVKTGKPSALPKPKPKPDPKPAAKPAPKPTQTTTTKPTGKPTAGAGRANLKPTSPATRGSRKPVRATRKPVRAERKPVGATTKVVKPKPKPATRAGRRGVTGVDKGLAAAVAAGTLAAVNEKTCTSYTYSKGCTSEEWPVYSWLCSTKENYTSCGWSFYSWISKAEECT